MILWPKVARCGALVVAAFLLMSPLHVWAQHSNDRDPDQSSHEKNRSQEAVADTSVLRLLFDEAIKIYAAEKAANAGADKQREERELEDLQAQNEMARWAFYMVVAAAVQLAVGAVTLVFLWLTFREAKRTADSGIEAAQAASRAAHASVAIELPILTITHPPYLSDMAVARAAWEGAPTVAILADGQRRRISALLVSNHGRTPALITRVSTGYWAGVEQLPDAPTFTASHHFTAVHVLAEGAEHRPMDMPGVVDIDGPLIDEINAGTATLYLFVMMEFEDFMRNIRHAGFCYRWTRVGADEFAFVPATDVPEKYTPKPQDG